MRRVVRVLFAGALMFSGGCSRSAPTGDPNGSAYSRPDGLERLSFLWGAEPGVDLENGPAVAVRAYLESFTLGTFGGDRALYPGFVEATPGDSEIRYQRNPERGEHAMVALRGPALRPSGVPGSEGFQVEGTEFDHVLSLEEARGRYWAAVCVADYGVSVRWRGSDHYLSYSNPRGDYRNERELPAAVGVDVVWIQLARSIAAPVPEQDRNLHYGPALYTIQQARPDEDWRTPSGQIGPSSSPKHAAFGDWTILAVARTRWEARTPDPITGWKGEAQLSSGSVEQMWQSCISKVPDDEQKRRTLVTGEHPEPYATQRFSPGWPVG